MLDQLRAQTESPDKIYAVQFVHGRKRRVGPSSIRLGKAYFVNRLLSLIQTRRIHLPKTREAQALAQELLNYEVRVNENGRDRYGAFRAGTHDDLVTALGLAVQVDL